MLVTNIALMQHTDGVCRLVKYTDIRGIIRGKMKA